MVGHSLPEVEQKILDLGNKINKYVSLQILKFEWPVNSSRHCDLKLSRAADYHLLKVDVDGVVQDALTVRFIHHDQSVHLQREDDRMCD